MVLCRVAVQEAAPGRPALKPQPVMLLVGLTYGDIGRLLQGRSLDTSGGDVGEHRPLPEGYNLMIIAGDSEEEIAEDFQIQIRAIAAQAGNATVVDTNDLPKGVKES